MILLLALFGLRTDHNASPPIEIKFVVVAPPRLPLPSPWFADTSFVNMILTIFACSGPPPPFVVAPIF